MRKTIRDRIRTTRSRLILLSASIAIAALAVWHGLYRLFGDGVPGLGYVNAFGYEWGVLAILLAAIFAISRAWIGVVVATALALATLEQAYFPLPNPAAGTDRLRVVTASLRSQNRYMVEAAERLATLDPDILVVQEVSDPHAFIEAFRKKHSGWHVAAHVDLLIMSRWPVKATRSDRLIFRAQVESPTGRLSIWNIHAPKYYRRVEENRLYYMALADDIKAVGGHGIAAGDFNATPWNEGYAAVGSVMQDGYRRVRWLPGFTFPGPARRSGAFGPFVAIDHIFATAELKPSDAKVVSASKGADHLPLIVDYSGVNP